MKGSPKPSSRFMASYRTSLLALQKVLSDSLANMLIESDLSQTHIIRQYITLLIGTPVCLRNP